MSQWLDRKHTNVPGKMGKEGQEEEEAEQFFGEGKEENDLKEAQADESAQ